MKPTGLVLIAAAWTLSGCGNDVRGVYSNPEGNASVEFMADGALTGPPDSFVTRLTKRS